MQQFILTCGTRVLRLKNGRYVAVSNVGVVCLILFIAALPLLKTFSSGASFFDFYHEFIAYRMGDALNMMFNENWNVHPVQGLPNALLSKIITRALYSYYRTALVTPAVLQIYCAIFSGVGFAILALFLCQTWPSMTGSQRVGAAVMVILPWYLPGYPVLRAPEYWFAEYLFLSCSLMLLVISPTWRSKFAPLALGAWIAFGVATKITLLPIAPILFLALPRRRWIDMVYCAAAAALSYGLIILAYAGFKLDLAGKILMFQVSFFINPNESQSFPDVWTALTYDRSMLALTGLALTFGLLQIKVKPREVLASFLWIAVYAYLIWRRPHASSLLSAKYSLVFLVCLFLPRLRAVSVAAVAALVLYVGPKLDFVGLVRGFNSVAAEKPPAWFVPRGGLFLPNNYWNAATPLQAFIYNGGLGRYPLNLNSDRVTYQYGGSALFALFGDHMILIEYISQVVATLKTGDSVYWTRPAENAEPNYVAFARPDYELMQLELAKIGATVFEEKKIYKNRPWIFGRASLP